MKKHKHGHEIDYIQYHTDLYIEPCVDDKVYHANIFPRSSISNKNLMLANSIGLIDGDYQGELLVRFKYVIRTEDVVARIPGHQAIIPILTDVNMDKIYKEGERIAQAVLQKPIKLNLKL